MAETEVLFFKNEKEFSAWMRKNHKKKDPVWVGFYKRALDKKSFSAIQAFDIALIYGWTSNVLKAIDHLSYKVRFLPRKPKSEWSPSNEKRFQELRKKGLVHPAGEAAFRERKQSKKEPSADTFSSAQLKKFKANKKAWEFFNSRPPGYRKYMEKWVASAKRAETQESRLNDLIRDSADGTKLRRIVEAEEKFKNRYEPGKTPIELAKNLGAMSGVELRSIGIETLEQLQRAGWERTFQKLVQSYPQRYNLNMLYSLAGAVNDQRRTQLDSDIKAECKRLFREMNS